MERRMGTRRKRTSSERASTAAQSRRRVRPASSRIQADDERAFSCRPASPEMPSMDQQSQGTPRRSSRRPRLPRHSKVGRAGRRPGRARRSIQPNSQVAGWAVLDEKRAGWRPWAPVPGTSCWLENRPGAGDMVACHGKVPPVESCAVRAAGTLFALSGSSARGLAPFSCQRQRLVLA